MKRLLLRGSAVGVVVITFIAAGFVGATAIRSKVDDASASRARAADSTRNAASGGKVAQAAGVADTTTLTPTPTNVPPAASAPAPTPPATQHAAVTARAPAPIGPVLPMGQSELPDGVTAVRGDSDVVVSFDLLMTRTRKPDKFEQFVRATLPAIYGRAVRDVLSKIPDGSLSGQGDLFTELPKRGMRIPVGPEWMIRLFPEARPGQDGPLVVRYRVSVVPSGD